MPGQAQRIDIVPGDLRERRIAGFGGVVAVRGPALVRQGSVRRSGQAESQRERTQQGKGQGHVAFLVVLCEILIIDAPGPCNLVHMA